MMAMSPTSTSQTSTKGGVMKGLRRSLGGESFFMNTFTANGPDAHVVVARRCPATSSPGRSRRPSTSSPARTLRRPIDRHRQQVGRGEDVLQPGRPDHAQVHGTGDLVVSSYGAIHAIDLAPARLRRRHRAHGRLGGGRPVRGAQGRQLEVDDPRRRRTHRPLHRPRARHIQTEPAELHRLDHPASSPTSRGEGEGGGVGFEGGGRWRLEVRGTDRARVGGRRCDLES